MWLAVPIDFLLDQCKLLSCPRELLILNGLYTSFRKIDIKYAISDVQLYKYFIFDKQDWRKKPILHFHLSAPCNVTHFSTEMEYRVGNNRGESITLTHLWSEIINYFIIWFYTISIWLISCVFWNCVYTLKHHLS